MRKIYSLILLNILLISCRLTVAEKPPTTNPLPTGTHTTTPLPIIGTPTVMAETLTPTAIPPHIPTPTPYAKSNIRENTPATHLDPTGTITLTSSLNTSTPTSPTETLTPTQLSPCQATPTPYVESDQSMLGVWRVRHDVEREDLNCQSRTWSQGWKKLRGLPETVRIYGGKGSVFLSDRWVNFLDSINTQDAQRFLRREGNGWLNEGPFPKMEQLTFGGNYVEVTRIDGNKAYIKAFNNADHPPSASDPIIGNNTLIQTFSTVYSDGTWEMAGPAGPVYTFIIANSNEEELWIDINDLIRP